MKKLSLLLLVLALGSAGLYGQMAIGTNFSISGEATGTAGYDIDDEVFGFNTESSANIKIELVAKQSTSNDETVDMSGGWYGSIELNNFQVLIDSDEEDSTEFVKEEGMMMADGTVSKPTKERTHLYVVEPEIVAMLINGPLFLKIFAAPSNKADLVLHIEDDEDNDHKAEGDDDGKDVGSEINKGHGITLGYDTADLDLEIGVSSEEAFTEQTTAPTTRAATRSAPSSAWKSVPRGSTCRSRRVSRTTTTKTRLLWTRIPRLLAILEPMTMTPGSASS